MTAGAPLAGRWLDGPVFRLSGPGGSVTTRGVAAVLPTGEACGPAAAGAARELLLEQERRTGRPGLVVGAVPFDATRPAWLYVPEHVHRSAPELPVDGAAAVPARPDAPRVPDDPAYRAAVREALRRIGAGDLRKVVLARAVDVVADRAVDVELLGAALAAANPGAYVFSVDLPGRGVLTGASPELLVGVRNGVLTSNPLAGSARRRVDPAADAAARDALAASAKDREEHRLVVASVQSALAGITSDLEVPAVPSLSATPQLWHLSSTVSGRLVPGRSVLDAAYALHPTPAVCGVPAAAAAEAIAALEQTDRDSFAGLVGWMDSSGEGEWVVALRCGLVQGRRGRVHAGAGIVARSTPEAEHDETATKLQTFLRALVSVVGEASITVASDAHERQAVGA
jgi:isochorismate synthase